jgi:hypothetical protein
MAFIVGNSLFKLMLTAWAKREISAALLFVAGW